MAKRKDFEAQPSKALKVVVSSILKGKRMKVMLEEDLKKMGCHGLLEQPWSLRDEAMVIKLLTTKSNEWEQSLM